MELVPSPLYLSVSLPNSVFILWPLWSVSISEWPSEIRPIVWWVWRERQQVLLHPSIFFPSPSIASSLTPSAILIPWFLTNGSSLWIFIVFISRQRGITSSSSSNDTSNRFINRFIRIRRIYRIRLIFNLQRVVLTQIQVRLYAQSNPLIRSIPSIILPFFSLLVSVHYKREAETSVAPSPVSPSPLFSLFTLFFFLIIHSFLPLSHSYPALLIWLQPHSSRLSPLSPSISLPMYDPFRNGTHHHSSRPILPYVTHYSDSGFGSALSSGSSCSYLPPPPPYRCLRPSKHSHRIHRSFSDSKYTGNVGGVPSTSVFPSMDSRQMRGLSWNSRISLVSSRLLDSPFGMSLDESLGTHAFSPGYHWP